MDETTKKDDEPKSKYDYHAVLVALNHSVPTYAVEKGDLVHSICILFLGSGDDGMGMGGKLETPFHDTIEEAYDRAVADLCDLRLWDAMVLDEAQSDVDRKPEMLADVVKRALARDKELFACPAPIPPV